MVHGRRFRDGDIPGLPGGGIGRGRLGAIGTRLLVLPGRLPFIRGIGPGPAPGAPRGSGSVPARLSRRSSATNALIHWDLTVFPPEYSFPLSAGNYLRKTH